MSNKIEYVVTCSCGKEVRLGLSKREQRDRTLNLSTLMAAGLIEDFHGEHGTVTRWFSDEPLSEALDAGAENGEYD